MEAQEIGVSSEDVEEKDASSSSSPAGTRYCATVTRLKPWTEYEFTVRGRDGDDVGMPSSTTKFDTKPDCELFTGRLSHSLRFHHQRQSPRRPG